MRISPSRVKRKNNDVVLREGFISKLFPGLSKPKDPEPGINSGEKIKFLRLAISVVRLAEYDYFVGKNPEHFNTAKMFLFGRNTLFSAVCDFMKINQNMAWLKILAFKRSKKVGDPVFEAMDGEDAIELFKQHNLPLNPTAKNIQKALEA